MKKTMDKKKSIIKNLQPGVKASMRRKKRCNNHEGCTNQAVKGGVCITHGAKLKRYSHAGCKNKAQKGGVCITHGAEVKLCNFKGCNNQAKKGGVCITHGAKMILPVFGDTCCIVKPNVVSLTG